MRRINEKFKCKVTFKVCDYSIDHAYQIIVLLLTLLQYDQNLVDNLEF